MARFAKPARSIAALVVTVCVMAALPGAAVVAADEPPDCVEAMPIAELQSLLDAAGEDPATGEQLPIAADGLTVVRGTLPQAFTAQILGIDYGGAGIDHDLIVADLAGLGIDEGRGVWFGMSGSPVYIDGKLVGAVAYAFTMGPSSLAGITPAEEMLSLTTAAQPLSGTMSLTTDQRLSIAAQTSQPLSAIPGRIPRLQVPLALGGVSGERLSWLRREAARDRSRMTPVAGGGYSAGAVSTPTIAAGGNFGVAISYGDLTAAGTGTTTWVCGDEALAFGHPFSWSGRTTLSLHAARSTAIAVDPAIGSYKLATLGAPVGVVDQDRYAGLHGVVNRAPFTTPVTSVTVVEALNGALSSDRGMTRVSRGDYVPFVTMLHGLSNIDFNLDRFGGEGSSTLRWTVDMTHRGQQYRLRRTNMFNSAEDIAGESMMEPWEQLEQLAGSRFGRVRFDGVHLRADVAEKQRYVAVRRLQVYRGGRWVTPRRLVRVSPGQKLKVRVVARRFEGSRHVQTLRPEFAFTVPRRAAGSMGAITAGGGEDDFFEEDEFCFLEGECGVDMPPARTFSALVDRLARAPRNNRLTVTLLLESERAMVTKPRHRAMSRVVTGFASLPVRVRAR